MVGDYEARWCLDPGSRAENATPTAQTMAPLSRQRLEECQQDPRKFLAEMSRHERGSDEWRALAALFVIGCLNRGLEPRLVEEVATSLAAIDPIRHGQLLELVRRRRPRT